MCPRVLGQRSGLPRTHKRTHYNHKNICKGTTEWGDAELSCRDFQTIEEMNDAIVNSINKYVM